MGESRVADCALQIEEGDPSSRRPIRPPLWAARMRARWLWLMVSVIAVAAPGDLSAQGNRRESSRSRERARGSNEDWQTVPRNESGPATEATDMPRRSTRRSDVSGNDAGDRTPYTTGNTGDADLGAFESRFVAGRQVWRDYDLAVYAARLATVAHPEQAVVDWILKQTGTDAWHGNEIAVLAATRGRLRVFHTPEVQAQVAETVERFVHPVQSQVSMRLQFVATTDLEWRNGLVHLLKPLASGPEGQQVWLIAPEDAAIVRELLRLDRPDQQRYQQRILTYNGQPATVETGQVVNYAAGLELTTGIYPAYQPVAGRIKDGAQATLTPLWTTDGSGVDLDLKLTTRVVTKLHSASTAVPLGTGNQTASLQVPQVIATALEQTLRWPSSQLLLISAGVQPGVLRGKRGGLSLSPSAPELLVLAELEPPSSSRSAARRSVAIGRQPRNDLRR